MGGHPTIDLFGLIYVSMQSGIDFHFSLHSCLYKTFGVRFLGRWDGRSVYLYMNVLYFMITVERVRD